MKKRIIIITAVILIPVLLYAVFGLPIPVPFGFVVPTEDIKCGASMVTTVLKNGLPDAIDTSDYDITGSISLAYYDREIMGMNMTARYSYRHNGLYCITYRADYDNYNTDEFVDRVNKYMAENLDDYFKKSEPWSENDIYNGKADNYEYVYNSGAVSEHIYITSYKGEGIVKIDFMY